LEGVGPSNAPRNAVALLKTITSRAIKTTGTLIVNLVPDRFYQPRQENIPLYWTD
jgi:hypothetical protein